MRPLPYNTKVRFLIALVVVAVAAVTAGLLAPAARAQGQLSLFVSGLRLNGSKPVALLRVRNVSPNAGDTYRFHYTVYSGSGLYPQSQVDAGPGVPVDPGQTVEFDLAAIVTQYRAARELGPYRGPIQVIARGEGGFTRPFDPSTFQVEALQVEGRARFPAVVEWRFRE